MLCGQNPEQAWLQHEFKLTDAQFARVRQLDAQYQTECMDLCRRIGATNQLIRLHFISYPAPTPETASLLVSAAQLRTECQLHMLEYCYAVSREMPSDQGRRYLNWACDQALAMPHDGSMTHAK